MQPVHGPEDRAMATDAFFPVPNNNNNNNAHSFSY